MSHLRDRVITASFLIFFFFFRYFWWFSVFWAVLWVTGVIMSSNLTLHLGEEDWGRKHTWECTFTLCWQDWSHLLQAGQASAVSTQLPSPGNSSAHQSGRAVPGRQQGQGTAASPGGDDFYPGVWEWRHLAERNDSQLLFLCVCHALKRGWRKTVSPRAAFCPSWGSLWLLHLLQSLGDEAQAEVFSQDTRSESTISKNSHFIFFCTLTSLSGLSLFSTWQSHLRQVPEASPASNN